MSISCFVHSMRFSMQKEHKGVVCSMYYVVLVRQWWKILDHDYFCIVYNWGLIGELRAKLHLFYETVGLDLHMILEINLRLVSVERNTFSSFVRDLGDVLFYNMHL